MILSRFPIVKSDEHVYSIGADMATEATLGAVYAEIQLDISKVTSDFQVLEASSKKQDFTQMIQHIHIGDTPFKPQRPLQQTVSLHVFTTQLQPTTDLRAKHIEEAVECRLQQLIELHDFIKEKIRNRGSDELIMVLGDLNISALPLSKVQEQYVRDRSNKEMVSLLN